MEIMLMSKAPLSSKPIASSDADHGTARSPSKLRMVWPCLGLGLLALIVLAWLFGFTWWTVLIAALVIGCPAVMAWLLAGGLDTFPKPPRTDR
jgi:hypothetical protein